nr:hypothetical protein CFP56_03129 [Quercus suber]
MTYDGLVLEREYTSSGKIACIKVTGFHKNGCLALTTAFPVLASRSVTATKTANKNSISGCLYQKDNVKRIEQVNWNLEFWTEARTSQHMFSATEMTGHYPDQRVC